VSEALYTDSPGPWHDAVSTDEYQRLGSQVLNHAKVETDRKIKNPAISDDGLPLDVASALQEQRAYLEKHGTIIPTAINASRPH